MSRVAPESSTVSTLSSRSQTTFRFRTILTLTCRSLMRIYSTCRIGALRLCVLASCGSPSRRLLVCTTRTTWTRLMRSSIDSATTEWLSSSTTIKISSPVRSVARVCLTFTRPTMWTTSVQSELSAPSSGSQADVCLLPHTTWRLMRMDFPC